MSTESLFQLSGGSALLQSLSKLFLLPEKEKNKTKLHESKDSSANTLSKQTEMWKTLIHHTMYESTSDKMLERRIIART